MRAVCACAIYAGSDAGRGFVHRNATAILNAMTRLYRDVVGPVLAPRGSVICIGAFDGMHLGHRAVLARVRERAQATGLASIVVSFEPLPREFFAHARKVP